MMAAIFFASSLPKHATESSANDLYFSGIMPVFPSPWEFIVKKGSHLLVYALLALLTLRAFRLQQWTLDTALIASLVVTVIYAASDEFHQSFVAGRGASLRDIGIDTTGALLALTGAGWILGRHNTREAQRPSYPPVRPSNENSRPAWRE